METTPARRTHRKLQYGSALPRPRYRVRESRCLACMGSGTQNKTRLPGGALWVEPCSTCNGAGVIEQTAEV